MLTQIDGYKKRVGGKTPNEIIVVHAPEIGTAKEDVLKEYSQPESYELLATSFGNISEKVWAVIYGEVFCNLSSDKTRATHMGALVFEWYAFEPLLRLRG